MASHARLVSVIGTSNAWDGTAHSMQPEVLGYWTVQVEGAKVGDEYKDQLLTSAGVITSIDPYSRVVKNSVRNAMIYDPEFDQSDNDSSMAPRNQLVIYEFHVGTFNENNLFRPGRFIAITARLEHLKRLGANAIQIMPVRQFAGMRSWGYNSSHHFSPSNLDLWQLDGWSEEGIGILYFYNDARACTPWGETRPDYGRGEVSPFMPDNALMWLDEYRVDGLRFDIRP